MKVSAVLLPVAASNAAVLVTASPNEPIPLGMSLTLALGVRVVLHSWSDRWLRTWTLSSVGLKKSNAQAGLAAAMMSLLSAADIHDSTLQEPPPDTSDVSTW